MRKYRGTITFVYDEETAPGVFEEQRVSRIYRGDIIDERRSLAYRDSINATTGTSSKISIVADDFAFSHFTYIVSAELWGHIWQVTAAVPACPRIELSIGDLYKIEQEEETDGQ